MDSWNRTIRSKFECQTPDIASNPSHLPDPIMRASFGVYGKGHICLCVDRCTYIYIYIKIMIIMYIYIYIHTSMRIYVYICIYIYIYIQAGCDICVQHVYIYMRANPIMYIQTERCTSTGIQIDVTLQWSMKSAKWFNANIFGVVLQMPKMSYLSTHNLPPWKRRGVEQAFPTSGAYALGGQ